MVSQTHCMYNYTKNCLFQSDIIQMAQCMRFSFGTFIKIGSFGVSRRSSETVGHTVTPETAHFIVT